MLLWLLPIATSCRSTENSPKPAGPAVPAVPSPPGADVTARPAERLQGCKVEHVQAVVRKELESTKRCYRQALDRNPAASGKLSVELHIDKAGSARFLGVQTDEFGDEVFTRCLFAVLKPLPYPIPETEPCILVYPFVFTAGPGG